MIIDVTFLNFVKHNLSNIYHGCVWIVKIAINDGIGVTIAFREATHVKHIVNIRAVLIQNGSTRLYFALVSCELKNLITKLIGNTLGATT